MVPNGPINAPIFMQSHLLYCPKCHKRTIHSRFFWRKNIAGIGMVDIMYCQCMENAIIPCEIYICGECGKIRAYNAKLNI